MCIYREGDLDRLRIIDSASTDLLSELDKTISLGQTNLLLFQHLGPIVSRLASQYQQLLAQIDLVKEDISQLQ